MSRLTKYQRESITRRIMADVPTTDYEQQAQKLLQVDAVMQMPAHVQAMFNDVSTRDYFYCNYQSLPGQLSSVMIYASKDYKPSSDTMAQLQELGNQHSIERNTRRTIENNLLGVLHTCSTVKRAREALPQFVQYMPLDDEPVERSKLPAVVDLIKMIKDAGWVNK